MPRADHGAVFSRTARKERRCDCSSATRATLRPTRRSGACVTCRSASSPWRSVAFPRAVPRACRVRTRGRPVGVDQLADYGLGGGPARRVEHAGRSRLHRPRGAALRRGAPRLDLPLRRGVELRLREEPSPAPGARCVARVLGAGRPPARQRQAPLDGGPRGRRLARAPHLRPAPDAAEAAGREVGFPAVVKPSYASASRGVFVVRNPTEFREAYAAVSRSYGTPIVQEYIPGPLDGAFLGSSGSRTPPPTSSAST